jgi:hypothetical protein
MLPFDIIGALPSSRRYGSHSPWRAVHILVKDLGLSVAAAGFIACFAKGVARWLDDRRARSSDGVRESEACTAVSTAVSDDLTPRKGEHP